MDVEARLREADLPQVSVMVDRALAATTHRGSARRRRRTAIIGLGVVLVVAGLTLGALRLSDQDETTNVATGPSESAALSSDPETGEVAVWDVEPATLPSADSSSFTAMVTRLGCNDGVTGPVLRPGVVVAEDDIRVTFTVETIAKPGMHTCPGNDAVPYVVDLGEPIGRRTLVDGACAEGKEAATTSFCADTAGVRWRSNGGAILPGDFAVSGWMVSVGGPAGAEAGPAPGTVRAVNAAGEAVVTVDTDENGSFELAVPNGTYRLIGRPLYQGVEADCVGEADVVIKDRGVDGVFVQCQRR